MDEDTLDLFLVAKEATGLSPSTVIWYRRLLLCYLRYITDQSDDPADPHAVRRYLAAEAQRVSLSTADANYRALSAWCRWLVEEGIIDQSPLDRVKRPKVPKRAPRRASFGDYEQLLESIPRVTWIDVRDRLMVQLLFLSGVRVSELCGLAVKDVDVSARLIRVVGKGNKERLVPLYPSVGPALLEYLLRRPPWSGPELLLGNDGAGGVRGALTASGVRQRLRSLCERANVPLLNPHSFRHGLAMYLLNEGHADMSLVSKILGHADQKTTAAFYAEWITDGMISAFDAAMERAVRRKN